MLSVRIPSLATFVLAGALLGAGFIWISLWPVSLLGVWIYIQALESTTRWSMRIGGGILTFVIKSLCGIAWFWTVYPIDWLSIPVSWWQLPAIGLGWMVSGVALGSGAVVLVIGVILAMRYGASPLVRYFSYAVLWVGAEALGSLLFSLVTYGEGATITTAFSFGYLGYLTAHIPLLFALAPLGGVYVITATTVFGVLFFGFILFRLSPRNRFALIGGACGIVGVSMFMSGEVTATPLTNTTTTVALIDTSFVATLGQTEAGQARIQAALTEAYLSAQSFSPSYILFPEASGFSKGLSSEQAYELLAFKAQLGQRREVVIDSESVPSPEGLYLRAKILDGQTDTGYSLDKQYLVPVGEFIPSYVIAPLFSLFGGRSLFTTLEQSSWYRPGPFQELSSTLTHIPGILFCFEGVDPFGVTKLLTRNVPFVAHPFSHGWFTSTTMIMPQLRMMLRLQARAHHITIVSAGNQGDGAVYLPNGNWYNPAVRASGELWRVRVAEIPIREP